MGVPLALLGGEKYGFTGGLIGYLFGALVVGIPFDRFLEIRFCVLKVRQDKTSNKPTGSDVQ